MPAERAENLLYLAKDQMDKVYCGAVERKASRLAAREQRASTGGNPQC